MLTRTSGDPGTQIPIATVVFIAALIPLTEPRLAASPTGMRESSGVWCERRTAFAITPEHEKFLTLSLRRITGYNGLRFADDGSLILSDSAGMTGGSAEARRILKRAVCSNAVFVIEDYSGSGSVTFGQAVEELVCDTRDGVRSQFWRLRLDFEDFQQIGASSEVKAAFDEGFTLFHELLHGLGYNDASGEDEVGACEDIVNRIRGDLRLPLRDQYFGQTWRITPRLTSVRLRFRSRPRDGNSNRWASHYLFFLIAERDAETANLRAVTRKNRASGR